MKNQKFVKSSAALIVAAAFTANVYAENTPNADDLVGHYYGGLHGGYLKADDDRKATPDINSTLDEAVGLGLELGYRFTPKWEGRIAYTNFSDVGTKSDAFDADNGSLTSFDMLYFPNAQSFYGKGGFDIIDLESEDLSVNLGAGYRHYFSERFAGYVEGSGHYQFDANMKDVSAKLGLIYFFGVESKKPAKSAAPVQEAAPVAAAAVAPKPEVKDSDNDGVVDSLDLCANTPMTDKVDAEGCTIFTEKTAKMELMVNFDNNKAVVKDEYLPEIERAAQFLKTYPHVNLVIEGHTSSQGAAAYNKKLSQKRADAVVAKLVNEFGIDPARLTAVGYGEERLLDTSDTSQAHQTNRRIQAVVETQVKEAVKR
ncbi:OmpA family protein [Thalassotalea sp. LPB0316]|uniref:OmpA family protein n=1 Tax=Thalassotalea sp. LPB0316 TaxID=2769490 RepID=UPI0018692D5C|nr:OmpA family protein [Thalassotalea sp. LPB0316]QOL24959.1 OmpA family protein [Thalassotalea sp. LPB0316]